MNTSIGKQQHTSRHLHGMPALRRKLLPASLISLLGLFACGGEALAGGHVAANTTPTGGSIVGGNGSIAQNGANTTVVQKSQMLALNWQTFNVGENASVIFKQPSFTSVALNRILDQNASQIFGHVSANGQIFLINTHGIIFGRNSQVNVGGLVASTLDLTPNDFLSNHFNLDAHGGSAGIVNHGTIEAASGGSVNLVGGQVANDGLIIANYGHINLDGADRAVLDFDGDGLINVQVTGALQMRLNADEAAVSNKGTLKADNGTVVLQASAAKDLFTDLVNNSGVIQAGGINTSGGKVQLIASGGNAVTSGTIDVSGAEGGSVQVLSDQNVAVTGNIDASGTNGGGSIRVGGGYQGGEGLQTANATYVAPTATLKADATQRGHGGSVVVWGDQVNNFYGTVSARGGALGGNGGLVETSSHYGLDAQGNVDASAAHGKAGTWLLDPYNVTINSGSSTTNITTSGTTYTANGTGSSIGNGAINSALNNGTSVFVFTGSSGSEHGDITVNAPIAPTTFQSGTSSLYLEAAGSILLANSSSSNISSDGIHALNVNLWSNYGGSAAGTTYSAGSCSSCQVQLVGASISTTGGNVDIQTNGAVSLANNASITTGGGSVSIGSATTGPVGSLSMDGTSNIDTTGGSGNLTVLAAAGINAQGALTIGGTTSLSAGAGSLSASNASNNFNGAVSLSNTGNSNVDLDNDTNPLQLGNVTVGSGTLTVAATGITQATGTQITQASNAGAASFTGRSGVITLANTGNTFTGTVALSNSGNHNVALSTSNALQLGNVTVGSGTLTLTGVGISQAGSTSITQASSAGQATFNAGAGAITLGNSTNSFTGAVGLNNTGNNAVLLSNGSHALKLGNITVGTGTLGLSGVGVTQSSGTAITQTTGASAVTVTGGAASVTLNNSGNDFVGAVSVSNSGSSHNVQLNNGSNVLTLGTVTTGGSFSATSTTGIDLTQNISSANAQTYTGPVTLLNDATLTNSGSSGAINFSSTVDGAHSLSVMDANDAVSFGGAVGGGTSLTSLNVTGGGGITLGGNVTTTGGTQIYNGAVQLNGSTTQLTGSSVTASGGISGSTALTIAGNANLGGSSNLTSLAVTGTTGLSGSVSTSSTQAYSGDVTLNGDTTLNSGGNVVFIGKVDSGSSGQSLTLNTGSNTVTFDKAVGSVAVLSALTSNGGVPVLLNGNVSTSGAQSYGGAVQLGDNVTLSGSSVSFNSTIDNATTTPQSLTVDAAGGLVSFGGAVGASSNGALAALTTNSGTFSNAGTFNIGLGGLSLTTTGGGIAQGAAFTVTGASSFNAGNNGITLNAANALAGPVSLTNTGTHNVSLTNSGLLTLGTINVGSGTLGLTGAGIQQASTDTITQATGAGAASFHAGSNNITLTNANNFTGVVNLTGGTTAINDSGALTLGTLSTGSLTATSAGNLNLGSGSVGGNLSASSNGGAISQSGALTVTGTSTINAGAGSITLGKANSLTGAVSLTGGATTLKNSLATQLDNSTVSSLVLNSGGAITQTTTGVLDVTGTSSFTASGNTIALTNAATNQFGAAVSLTGSTTQIASNAALTLGTLATGDLTANSGGALNLGSGSVGSLTATGNGTISQSGALSVSGAAVITQNKSGGDILLGDAGNAFTNTIAFNPVAGGIGNLSFTNTAASAAGLSLPTAVGGNLTLDYSNASAQLTLPGTHIGGSLDLTAGGGITVSGTEQTGGGQAYHSAVTFGGATTLTGGGPITFDSSISGSAALTINAGSGDITLNNAGNALSGTVSLNGANATLFNSVATQLGASNLGGTLNVTSNGAITQAGALSVGSSSTFNAGSNTIALTASNGFAGSVSLTGTATQISNAGALTLGQLSTGTLTASSGGALNLGYGTVSGNLTANASGTVNQFSQTDTSKALTVSGAVNVTDSGAGDILLGNPGNRFGSVGIAGGSIGNIAVANTASGTAALSLPASIGGNLTLAYPNATLDLPGTSVGGSSSITAATIDIQGSETTGGGESYTGQVVLGNDATLQSNGNGDINIASGISGAHALTLKTGGNVTLGNATLNGLTSTSNTFSGGTLNINGNLAVTTTGGAITQSGAFTVTGNSAFNAGGNAITLTNGGNSFTGAVALTGGATQISQGSALTLGALHTGSLTVSSQGNLNLGSGSISGDLNATSHGGAVSEGGPLSVSGNSTIDAGTGAIALANASNAFGGAVNLSGGATQITDGSALNLGTLNTGDLTVTSTGNLNLGSGSIGGNLTASSNGGAISQTGALSVAGTTALNGGNGSVTLTNSGNVFTNAVTATGAGVSLNDSGDLTVAALTDNANGSVNLSAAGTLTAYGISAGSGNIALASNGGTLSTGGAISGGNISLTGLQGIASSNTITASGTLTLNSAQGSITSSGGMTAGTLTGSSGGATTLNGSNAIGTLSGFTANGFSLNNGQSLIVSGPVSGNTSTALNVTSGDLTLNSAISGTNTALSAAGAINEGSSGGVTASTLTGNAGGAATLNGSNQIGTLGNFNAANFSLIDGQALVVAGTIHGGASTSLTTNGGGLAINGAVSGTSTALHSAGDITESGSITAGTLSGSAAGAATLTGNNQVGTLGNFSANGFSFTDGQSLTVNGAVNGNGSAMLATTTGDITLNGAVSGNTVTLHSAGAINEGGDGVHAGTLTGSSAGATTLTGINQITTLGSFSANGFSLTNAQALTVGGPVNGGSALALTTTSGGISLNGAVNGAATSLNSAGTLNEGSGGVITADTLSGNANGVTTLTGKNKVNTLGDFRSLLGFSFANDQTLSLSSINGSGYVVNAGTSPVSIVVTNGNLYQTDHTWTYDGTGSWSSTGAIGTQANPIYVTGTTTQYVPLVGNPPAYFYAVDPAGAILPIVGDSVNIPTSLFSSRAQNVNNHLDSYIDASVITANYRSFGIVPSGILLPPDQQACQAGSGADCPEE